MADPILLTKPGLADSTVSLSPDQAAAPSDTGMGATPGSSPISLKQNLVNSGYTTSNPGSAPAPAGVTLPGSTTNNGTGEGYKDASGNWIYGTKPTATTTMTSDAATGDTNNTADIIRQEQDSLNQQLQAQTAEINAQGAIQDRQLAQTQTEENATNSATQFRLGREATDYASSATQKLNQLHLDQQAQMTQQRQALIGQANAAYRAGNIALAKELVQNAKDVATQQAQAKQDQAKQISQNIQDNINKQTLMTKTMDNLATSNIPLTSITQDAKTAYETQFGIPAGTFDALYTATQKAQGVKSSKDFADLATSMANLAEKIPTGTTQDIKMPDGSTYTVQGAKQPDHSSSYKEWQDYQSTGGKLDFNAYQTMDANRKRAVTNVTLQNDKITKDLVNKFAPTIEKVVGQDGKISPDDWNSLRTGWVKDGGSAPVFDASFGQFINPDTKERSKYFTEKLPGGYSTTQ